MIYLFDIDGTLTEPQRPISQKMTDVLMRLQETNDVYLVTGSDRDLIRTNNQVNDQLEQGLAGIFTCQGSELWQQTELMYQNEHTFDPNMITDLTNFVIESNFKPKTGKHINERPGMINFTVVGRNATLEQRKMYAYWDSEMAERHILADYMRRVYSQYDFSIGGEISIDINLKGANKSQIIKYIRDNGYKAEAYTGPFSFFGDKTHQGGNDYTLARALINESPDNKIYQVDGPDTTISLLTAIL